MTAFHTHYRPVNRDTAMMLWGSTIGESKVPIERQGLISRCRECGGRGYERGYCFGCGCFMPARIRRAAVNQAQPCGGLA